MRFALVLLGMSSASAFAPGAVPSFSSASQKLSLVSRRSMPVALGLRMEDNSFLKNVPKPKTLKSVGLSDEARAKVLSNRACTRAALTGRMAAGTIAGLGGGVGGGAKAGRGDGWHRR